jgi:Skp family chaperone for outer membrane proteins
MKKLLFFTLVTSPFFGGSAFGVSSADKLIEFKKLSKKEKNEWSEFAKKYENEKNDIRKNHKSDWLDHSIKVTEQLKNADLTTPEQKEILFTKQLADEKDLRKKQNQEWRKFYERIYASGKEVSERQDKDLAKFEESLEEIAG